MPWVKVDDSFYEHPKMARVGPLGWGYWLAGLAYCNRNLTDGFIPRSVAHTLASTELVDDNGTVATLALTVDCGMFGTGDDIDSGFVVDLLVGAGLWETVPGGYQVHDYFDHQPSKADVLALREARRAAGSRGGKTSSRAKNKQVLKQVLKQESSKTEANTQPRTRTQQENPKGFSQIVDSWLANAPPLIEHRDSIRDSAAARRAVAKAVKAYGLEDVVQAVANYAQVLGSQAHFFEYRWTLPEFLTRGIHKFVAEARPLDNFRSKTSGRDRGVSVNDIFTILEGGGDEPRALPSGRVA